MLTRVGILLALLLVASPAFAGDIVLLWNPGTGSTSTDLEQSLDSGLTWTVVKNVPNTACSGTPLSCNTTYAAPGTGLVLFRFTGVNAVGKVVRSDAGPWYNEKWILPTQPRNVGAQ